MRRSEAKLFTRREAGGHESQTVQLVRRAGLVRQFGSGLYGFTPTGERVRQAVVDRIDEEMAGLGAQKISLPQLNYRGIWEKSGRWDSFGAEMFTVENRDGQQMCLAPSHEEGVVHLFEGLVRSYEDLPLLCYQIGRKHRDDHARMGLLRTKEFTMKDAYSLHATRESLTEQYEQVRAAYCRLFDRLGLDVAIADADNSVMGGPSSEEFVAPVETGTADLVFCPAADCRFGATDDSGHPGDSDAGGSDASDGDAGETGDATAVAAGEDCPDCGTPLESGEGIEIAHIFRLGTRYSEPMGLTVDMADGSRQDVLMASYGIGIDRLLHTLVAQHADADGCRWPGEGTDSVAPYTLSIIPLEYDDELAAVADVIHEEHPTGETLLFDDPDQSIGERLAESDLLGIPYKLIIGNNFREMGELELETRDGDTRYIRRNDVKELFD
jgi:prolyl-tRNA synthetase